MKVLFAIFACLLSAQASATVYKCVNAQGKTDYQSSPCSEDNSKKAQVNLTSGNAIDLDEEKRLAEQKEQQRKAQEEKDRAEQQRIALEYAQLKKDSEAESAKNQLLIKQNPGKFSAYAIPPYKLDNLTSLVKAFKNQLPEIEKLRGAAALKAIASAECGRAEDVELSERSKLDALVFLVNCSSGKTLYFNKQDLQP
ncbi:hypothetical protein JCM14076_08280 [Methylosoma difficile]